MGNPVVHWELMSKNPEKVSKLYAKLFGWTGGKIHVEEQKVRGMGKFSLFTDPEGRMMGLWKSG